MTRKRALLALNQEMLHAGFEDYQTVLEALLAITAELRLKRLRNRSDQNQNNGEATSHAKL